MANAKPNDDSPSHRCSRTHFHFEWHRTIGIYLNARVPIRNSTISRCIWFIWAVRWACGGARRACCSATATQFSIQVSRRKKNTYYMCANRIATCFLVGVHCAAPQRCWTIFARLVIKFYKIGIRRGCVACNKLAATSTLLLLHRWCLVLGAPVYMCPSIVDKCRSKLCEEVRSVQNCDENKFKWFLVISRHNSILFICKLPA